MKTPKLLKATATAFGLARKTSDVEAIEAAMVEARTMILEGEREESEAQGRYHDALLNDDGDPAAILNTMQAAKIKRDMGEARIADLTARLAAVRAAEEQARRRGVYEDAQAKAEAGRVALLQDYPVIARQVHALLRTLAEAERAVALANTNLPTDAEALASPEREVRAWPYRPFTVSQPEIVQLWKTLANIEPLADRYQGAVKPNAGDPDTGTVEIDGRTYQCQRIAFVRTVESRPQDEPDFHTLASALCLPALHPSTAPMWEQSRGRATGEYLERGPGVVLDQLAAVEPIASPVWRRPEPPKPTVNVRYEQHFTPPPPDPSRSLSLRLAGPGADRGEEAA